MAGPSREVAEPLLGVGAPRRSGSDHIGDGPTLLAAQCLSNPVASGQTEFKATAHNRQVVSCREMPPRPFISYAREDRDMAVKLRNDLVELGARPWLDKFDLVPGQNWERAVTAALQRSTHFIALISTHSVNKRGFVQKELREALTILETFPPDHIFIVPVRLDSTQPAHEGLRRLHWVDLFEDYEAGLRDLGKSIGLRRRRGSSHRSLRNTLRTIALRQPPVTRQTFRQAIQRLRQSLGITQVEFAELLRKELGFKAGPHPSTIARWEAGHSIPSGDYVRALDGIARRAGLPGLLFRNEKY